MPTLVDSHVHVYPSHSPERILASFRAAVRRAGAGTGAMCLVEREGMDAFREWARGVNLPHGTRVTRSEETAFMLEADGEVPVVVVAGRQIACAERVEILALGTTAVFRDGMAAADAVLAARDAGALPVLAWGVGKWLFSRAAVVDALLRRFPADELFLGDTSLRPVFWPTPGPMAQAPTFGRRVLHGSDPLPPAREEIRAGQWADLAEDPLADDKPLASAVLGALREAPLVPAGRRSGLFQFVRRMVPVA